MSCLRRDKRSSAMATRGCPSTARHAERSWPRFTPSATSLTWGLPPSARPDALSARRRGDQRDEGQRLPGASPPQPVRPVLVDRAGLVEAAAVPAFLAEVTADQAAPQVAVRLTVPHFLQGLTTDVAHSPVHV